MSQVRFQAIDVKTDLGVREGCLALVDDVLLAVFVRVGTEETRSNGDACEGWFREAGFGPCGDINASRPGIFGSLTDAARWIGERLGGQPAR